MPDTIHEGDAVLLLGPDGERHVVAAAKETRRVGGLGILDLSDLIAKPWGGHHRFGLKDYILTRPVLVDHLRVLERKAQIITAKDSSRILLETGLAPGMTCVEGGAGSGGLTLVLAHAVGPMGGVTTYDLRDDHIQVARRNLERAGLAGRVEFKKANVHTDVTETGVDAFVVDVPDPERAPTMAKKALRPGGVFAAYAPNTNQADAAHRALKAEGFLDVHTLELLEREWTVHERGMRPSFEMLGHTAFLTFARRP